MGKIATCDEVERVLSSYCFRNHLSGNRCPTWEEITSNYYSKRDLAYYQADQLVQLDHIQAPYSKTVYTNETCELSPIGNGIRTGNLTRNYQIYIGNTQSDINIPWRSGSTTSKDTSKCPLVSFGFALVEFTVPYLSDSTTLFHLGLLFYTY